MVETVADIDLFVPRGFTHGFAHLPHIDLSGGLATSAVTITQAPSIGTVAVLNDGRIVYHRDTADGEPINGSDSFQITLTNPDGDTLVLNGTVDNISEIAVRFDDQGVETTLFIRTLSEANFNDLSSFYVKNDQGQIITQFHPHYAEAVAAARVFLTASQGLPPTSLINRADSVEDEAEFHLNLAIGFEAAESVVGFVSSIGELGTIVLIPNAIAGLINAVENLTENQELNLLHAGLELAKDAKVDLLAYQQGVDQLFSDTSSTIASDTLALIERGIVGALKLGIAEAFVNGRSIIDDFLDGVEAVALASIPGFELLAFTLDADLGQSSDLARMSQLLGEMPTSWFDNTAAVETELAGRTTTGTTENDFLLGTNNSETLIAGAGDDTIDVGVGNVFDSVDGGAGVDVLVRDFSDIDSGLTFEITQTDVDGQTVLDGLVFQGSRGFISFKQHLAFENIERLDFTGNHLGNTMVGGALSDTLDGRGGDDDISGGLTDDLDGGDGTADLLRIDVSALGDAIDLDVADQDDVLSDGTRFRNFERFQITTGAGDDRFVLGNNSDTVISGSGDDTIDVGLGNRFDSVDGGAGVDVLVRDFSAHASTLFFTITATEGETGTVLSGNVQEDRAFSSQHDTRLSFTNIERLDFTGNDLRDTMVGGALSDTLHGRGGDDDISGGLTDDLDGGDGTADLLRIDVSALGDAIDLDVADQDDVLSDGTRFRNFERFQITTGAGDDRFVLGNNSDTVISGSGDDTIDVGLGNRFDSVDGGAGVDVLVRDFSAHASTLFFTITATEGETGTVLSGNVQEDRAFSSQHDTRLSFTNIERLDFTGNDLRDTMVGGALSDTLHGRGGNDQIFGGAGSDQLSGGEGNDQIFGGEGIDTAFYGRLVDFEFVLDQNGGFSTVRDLIGNGGIDTLDSIEVLDFAGVQIAAENVVSRSGIANASASNDAISGSEQDDIFALGDGDDWADGGAGRDSLLGQAGSDIIYGREGLDTLRGGTGEDYLDGGEDADLLLGDAGRDTLIGGSHRDTMFGGDDNDSILGGDDVDSLRGDGGDDFLDGGAILDFISGNAGNDTLIGGDGNDRMFAGTGNDLLQGDTGNDQMFGDAGNDTLFGGDGFDRIDGGAGNDSLEAGGGGAVLLGGEDDDTVVGGALQDLLFGDAGADSIAGGTGNDFLRGGTGNDTLRGEAGVDGMRGEDGDDQLFGGDDTDIMEGDDGNDTLSGDNGDDRMLGGLGLDVMFGGQGIDRLDGGDGNDSLDGGTENDDLLGSTGDDTILGGAGNDRLFGQADNDQLFGGGGADRLDAGTGNNLLDGGAGNDTLIGRTGDDTLAGGDDNDRMFGIEGADSMSGGAGLDTMQGGIGNDTMAGDGGNDLVFGEDGNDSLDGGEGNDRVDGGLGDDILAGGAGIDTLIGRSGADTISGDAGDDLLFAGAGNDSVSGGADNDRLVGEDGNDTMAGDGGNDSLEGRTGDDSLSGGDGLDQLLGQAGADQLDGGTGNDTLSGGEDDDTLIGGAGADRFHFLSFDGAGSNDLINDFEVGVDTFLLSGLSVASVADADVDGDTLVDDTLVTFSNGATAGLIGVTGLVEADLF